MYRYEKNKNGEQDLVISGFEKGIADSPLVGIGNLRNLNVNYYPGVSYVNYKRKPCTIYFQSSTGLTGSLTTGATSATLSTNWIFNSGSYSTKFSNGDVRTVTFTNGSSAISWTGGLSSSVISAAIYVTPNVGQLVYKTISPVNTLGTPYTTGIIYLMDLNGLVYYQSHANSSIFYVLGNQPVGSGGTGLQFWNGYLFVFGINRIDINGDGSGDGGITSANWNTGTSASGVWPIKYSGSVSLTGNISAGDSSATISSYTDAQGTSRAFWNGPTGVYSMYTVPGRTGDHYLVSLTQGSATINFTPVALHSSGTSKVYIYSNQIQAEINKTWVSRNDGLLYFCNGSTVGSFEADPNQIFDKTNMDTFAFNYASLSINQEEEINNLEELQSNLILTTNYNIYSWDRTSPQVGTPVPVQEKIFNMINILNSLYVIAGNKGNIYLTNGYSVSPFKKLPDYIAGVIDPCWLWGDMMSHRQKLYVQATAVNGQTGSAIMSGIFSLGLVSGNGVTIDTSGILNMEAQNSYGLVPAYIANSSGVNVNGGVLMDNNSTLLNYDNYYSAWYQGTTQYIGGLDFNDTTLWSSNEPLIETELIPIGTSIQPKTFASMEFKLDQPMQSGDSITVYARQSLSDAYTLVGTTTTAVLSDFYSGVSFQNWQWIQLKVTFACNPTTSSFIPLREIRLR